ncbi:MAG TPA: tetratricopeptide repeat protein [Actinophytocola sp.]|uniref:AfsR/SARP family transcriptional regulator n=1 Tax=Actinophytocola sp. TaxID=1872138 RepID=UPI002DBBEFCD|nr:tetratricopeptide repeat protein [Actinophytocola sp.]HEU5475613.1 tetratricopeptide repeat protein [Actinophytocola sp.]
MEFRMLGPFEAWHDDRQVDLGDQQQRFVLVVLLLHANRPVSGDRLIDIVWGDRAPSTNLVPGYIAKLRKSFKAAGGTGTEITTTPTGYVLRVGDDEIDTVRFTRLCAEAETAKRAGDRVAATALLRRAVGLWRGDFLEDIDIDRVGGTDVVTAENQRLDALGDLAELELAAGNHRRVRDRLGPVVRADPSRVRPAELLMRALLAGDDRVAAMRLYQQTVRALDAYGMPVPAELRDLAWLARYDGRRGVLPGRPARFTGRAGELAAIEAVAGQVATDPRVVWLSGPPGVGKSALAIEAAHRLRDRFPDGALLVELDGFTPNAAPVSPADALGRLLTRLGLPDEAVPPTLTARRALYQGKLHGTRTLVVLDNASSADQVRPLLPEAPGCLAIVTSRRVGDDLEVAEVRRLGPLPPQEAAELFGKLAGPDRLRARGAAVAEVVARCDRLPLPIKVAAAQFRRHDSWPVEHLVRLLRESGSWAGFGDVGVAFRVSYQQLDQPAGTLFRLYGAIPAQDLDGPAAAALTGRDTAEAAALLDELHGTSLLEEATPGRYHMLDPLKEFAATLSPAEPAEVSAGLARLLDFYLVTTGSAIAAAFPFDGGHLPAFDRGSASALAFDDEPAALSWLATERTNLIAAIRYAKEHDHREHTWRLAVLLWRYLYTLGHLEDWTETLELARQTVTTEPPNSYGQAHVLVRLSTASWRVGRITEALELAEQALPLWVALGDVRGEADTLCAIAGPMADLGDPAQAITGFEQAQAKYERIGHERGQAYALSMLGYLNEQRGELAVAHRQHLAAVDMLRRVGYRSGLAHALNNLGTVQLRLGQPEQALANHEQAHAIAVEIGDRCVEAYALNYTGNVHRSRGDLAEARRYQERAKLVANSVADAHLRTQLYLDRAATFHALHDQESALRAYQAAYDLAGGTRDHGKLAQASHGTAQVLHETGDHQQAVDYWHTAEQGFDRLDAPEATQIRQARAGFDCACGYPDERGARNTPVSSG